jgi:hypothetical protein
MWEWRKILSSSDSFERPGAELIEAAKPTNTGPVEIFKRVRHFIDTPPERIT